MAVEAQHLSLLSPQLLSNREMMNGFGANENTYGSPIGFGVPPLSETLQPMYGSIIADLVPAKTADSGLTYNLPVPRKRPRDSINPLLSFPNVQNQNLANRRGSFTFLGEDISLQIQQQQLDIDRFITRHMEKVKMDYGERRRRYSRRVIAAMEEGMMEKLRTKEEEIEKIGKLNWALEEKVKSLFIENQIWRELAQANEATANALRNNLEQVLAHAQDTQLLRNSGLAKAPALVHDDAQSCCGSNFGDDDDEWRTLAESRGEREVVRGNHRRNNGGDSAATRNNSINGSNKWCRKCGKQESCVLILPCRHLCLCTVCGSSLHTCPICKSTKTASLHVILSSS
ncbi:unnamed protein product [Ilex paraguariensis]|uniref:RING-type domain-containing protein n=1 Tax=Ilex paraguariensis TaxID=185542 RepID=A0ABC8T8D8_9AQUA